MLPTENLHFILALDTHLQELKEFVQNPESNQHFFDQSTYREQTWCCLPSNSPHPESLVEQEKQLHQVLLQAILLDQLFQKWKGIENPLLL